MTPKIIFEDSSILVIDKPSGLTVNQDETTKGQETVEEWVNKRQNKGSTLVSIVHRLDKDTSGLLVMAKTPGALEKLQLQFKNREVVKKYLALVHGKVEPPEGIINAPIGRNPFNRTHFGVFPGGREAYTSYRTYKAYKTYTLLELNPKTGRTHQIRVHLKYLGYPIVSDPVYGGRKNLRADLKFCPRLFLHAAYLKIKHPETGKVLEFNSPLPADLNKVTIN